MAEKRINGRIVLKHDIESNWKLATGFTPMAGEIIIYDTDSNYDYERIKIGDGVQNVNALPFVDELVRNQILDPDVYGIQSIGGNKVVTVSLVQGSIDSSTGEDKDDTEHLRTDFIRVLNRKFTLYSNEAIDDTFRVYVYDADKNWISDADGVGYYRVDNGANASITSKAVYIKCRVSSTATSGSLDVTFDDVAQEEHAIHQKIYFPHGYNMETTKIDTDLYQLQVNATENQFNVFTIAAPESDASEATLTLKLSDDTKTQFVDLSCMKYDDDATGTFEIVMQARGETPLPNYVVAFNNDQGAGRVQKLNIAPDAVPMQFTSEGIRVRKNNAYDNNWTDDNSVTVNLAEMATKDEVGAIGALVGDTSVAEQISDAIAEFNAVGGADWNQNNPGGAGYVTNRTHYVKEPIVREFYSYTNSAPSFKQHRTTKKYYTSINQVPYFTIGRTYLLTINGKEYEMAAQDEDFLGNQSLSGSYENTGEDFLIRSTNIYIDGDTPPSTINILINEIYEEVIQLDEKFIGYKPGKIVAGKEYVIDVDGVEQTFVAGRGAEVFNDYKWNIAIGEYSHAEGGESLAIGYASHAEGYGSVAADGEVAHAEGVGYAFGYATHAEGGGTASCGYYSHAEGYETEALYYADHSEGCGTVASGSSSHAEGEETLALEWTSHSEGYRSVAAGTGSHAEGYHGDDTVIEVHISGEANSNTFQLDNAYDIEVGNMIVYRKKFNYEISYEPYDRYAFITNYDPATLTITTSRNLSGDDAIDGEEASIYKSGVAAGDGSHIEGEGTFAMGTNQHVQGRYNVVDSEGKYAHIVGNGTNAKKSNAHTVDWQGNAWFAGDVYVGGTSKDDASRLVKFSEIPEGSTIDASLTQSGQAADAKSTGDAINSIKELVGDAKVSEQINNAVTAIKPKCTSITLPAASWTGDTNPWSQVVNINGVTTNSKVDLQPTAVQIVELQNNDIALMAENDDGVVTVYAIGSKPTVDYTMQVLITEVAVV